MDSENKIPVNCAYDEMVNICDLKPHPRNPNIHPSDQIKLLAKAMNIHGWRSPITVSKLSGYIIRGHCRLYAAKGLGLIDAPVDFQDYKNEIAELNDLVADNSIAELSTFDPDMLQSIIESFDDDLGSILGGYIDIDDNNDETYDKSGFDLEQPEFNENEKESIRLVFFKKDKDEIINMIKNIINEFEGASYYG
jgi:hypothetical protein